MKKLFAILVLSFVLVSCQKDKVEDTTLTQEKVFIQVEAIHDDGSSVYSNIVFVR